MKYITKIDFCLNFIRHLPQIGFRFLNLLFSGKKLVCKNFYPDSSYCIVDSINQLLWEVENAVFITLSNSSEIFFDSGQLLFKVKEQQSQFRLIAYGVGLKKRVSIQIKIVSLEKFDFNIVNTQTKSIIVDYRKTIKSSAVYLNNTLNSAISFRKPPKLIKNRKIQVNFNHTDFINNSSDELLKTKSIPEVNGIREAIDSNTDKM